MSRHSNSYTKRVSSSHCPGSELRDGTPTRKSNSELETVSVIIVHQRKSHRSIKVQRIIGLLIMTVFLSPVSGLAQARKRTTTRPTRSIAAPVLGEAERAGAARVAEQIKVLTRFISLLGGEAKARETSDDATSRNEASAAIIDQTKQS